MFASSVFSFRKQPELYRGDGLSPFAGFRAHIGHFFK
jgi:hypothetical protein